MPALRGGDSLSRTGVSHVVLDYNSSRLNFSPNFVFAFRTLLGLMTLLLIGTLVRRGPKALKPAPAPASTSPE